MLRQTGIACVGVMLLGVAAFQYEARSAGSTVDRAALAQTTASLPAASGVENSAPPAESGVAEDRIAADTRPAETRASNPPRRSSRGRGRNIYPGPIPTPEEWAPPEGPVRIALQAGHWRANEAPDELRGLRDNGTAARGVAEWEANLEIARRAAAMLEPMGYLVDILPAVVPPSYRAHLFVSIHADGSLDPSATGFRVSGPGFDTTGRASEMAALLARTYGESTGLRKLPDVTRRMENYYAFNFRRYVHALHPMTIAVILETGFLTSPSDWELIVNDPDRAARGIVSAVTAFPITPPPLGVVATTVDEKD